MIPKHILLSYYKREDIQKELLENAKDREVAFRFDEGFGPRPDVLSYAKDIIELAKQGCTSFHASEELWKNPLNLDPMMRRKELDELRLGWDLVIDIDCKDLEYSKVAADLVIQALKFHGIKSISCKFSGNKGFHIGVPFEAFPERINDQETRLMFPEAPRRIALYLREMIKQPLGEKILALEKNDISLIVKNTGKEPKEITYFIKGKYGEKIPKLNVEPFLNIDTILLSSRHLYRMPYSLHEKSNLASVPVNPDSVLSFDRKAALPDNVAVSKYRFLDKNNVAKGEATQLLVQAFDFSQKQEEKKESREFEKLEDAIPEQFFPPCIKLISKGLEDGRKRAVFILINFLSSVGWSYDMIEKYLREWNKKNREELREVYFVGQLRYHKQRQKNILPPNCQNQMYYKDFHVCVPDKLCEKIRNPVNYAILKAKDHKKHSANQNS